MCLKQLLVTGALLISSLGCSANRGTADESTIGGNGLDDERPSQLVVIPNRDRQDAVKSTGDRDASRVTVGNEGAAVSKSSIMDSLAKRVTVTFRETSLGNAILKMRDSLGINVVFATKAIKEAGCNLDEPISLSVSDVSVRSLLRLLLEPYDLDFVVHNEVLLISTAGECRARLVIRAYDISDLVKVVARADRSREGDVVAETIKTILRSSVGNAAGEVTGISEFTIDGTNIIIVRQSQRDHEQLEELLTVLREDCRRLAAKTGDATPEDKGRKIDLTEPPSVPLARTVQIQSVVDGNSRFALDLFAKLREGSNQNIFISPYSLSSAMAMVYAGARNDTASEIAGAMSFPVKETDVHRSFSIVRHILASSNPDDGFEIRIANRLWGRQGYQFLDAFLNITREQYGAELAPADFRKPELAARKINQWIQRQTAGMIEDAIDASGISPETQLVLTNAVYFDGKWTTPFDEESTIEATFDCGEKAVTVPMMHREEKCGYAAVDGLQIVEKPYGNEALSMLILLPERKPKALDELESALALDKFAEWTSQLKARQVEIFLPRFKINSQFTLNDTFSSMGMRSAFTSQADFSGLNSQDKISLSTVRHIAMVEVHEEGTKAAAATSVVMSRSLPFNQPMAVEFRADHPFIFLIRDNRTGMILFLGRLVNPTM